MSAVIPYLPPPCLSVGLYLCRESNNVDNDTILGPRWSSVTSSLMLASAPQLISVRISAKSLLDEVASGLVVETISCRAVRPSYADAQTETYRHTDRQTDL